MAITAIESNNVDANAFISTDDVKAHTRFLAALHNAKLGVERLAEDGEHLWKTFINISIQQFREWARMLEELPKTDTISLEGNSKLQGLAVKLRTLADTTERQIPHRNDVWMQGVRATLNEKFEDNVLGDVKDFENNVAEHHVWWDPAKATQEWAGGWAGSFLVNSNRGIWPRFNHTPYLHTEMADNVLELVVCRMTNDRVMQRIVTMQATKRVVDLKQALPGFFVQDNGEELFKINPPLPLPNDPGDLGRYLLELPSAHLEPLGDAYSLAAYFRQAPSPECVHIFIQSEPIVVSSSKRSKRGLEDSTDAEEQPPKRAKQEATVRVIRGLPVPSKIAKMSEAVRELQSHTDYPILYLRPATACGRPTCLFNSTVNRFLADFRNENLPISKELYQLADDFQQSAVDIFRDEDQRRAAYRPFFKSVFGEEPHIMKLEDGCELDDAILHPSSSAALLLWEYKNELGINGEPLSQLGVGYGRFWAQQARTELRRRSYSPTILIVVAGPWLCVLSAVFVEKIMIEPLTDLIFCGGRPNDDLEGIGVIARLFQALRLAHKDLAKHYKDLSSSTEPQYPFPAHDRFKDRDDKEVKVVYKAIMDETKLLWRAEIADTKEAVVIKFTPRYCAEAHQLLTQRGFAPRLLNRVDKMVAWKMVVMEFINGSIGLQDLAGEERQQVIGKVKEAVKVLHDSGYVFGDLREPNIMVVRKEEGEAVPILVDFDWCGKQGEATYPRGMNYRIDWPEGVVPGGSIRFEHDLAWIEGLEKVGSGG
ncbi:hypothetical protein FRB99_006506 [Tulasnella sp. 403]|nr:hypothetical protein FRB99_006506 [Tulasnella sp. 403]